LITKTGHGGAVLALDFLFSEPDRTSPAQVLPLWSSSAAVDWLRANISELPDHDAIFSAAMAKSSVVSGFVLTQRPGDSMPPVKWTLEIQGSDPRPLLPDFTGAIVNLPQIDAAAVGSGSFNMVPERDSINRRIHLLFRLGDVIYPSLAAETLRAAQQATTYVIRSPGSENEQGLGAAAGISTIKIGELAVPTDDQGRIWLHYTEFEPSRYIAAWKVLDENFDVESLSGHILLLGTTAAGLKDQRATPLNPVASGVEIQASIIEQILLGHFLLRPGWAEAAELIYLVALLLVLMLLLPRLRAIGGAIVGSTAVVFAAGLSWYAYTELLWLVDPVLPSLMVLLLYIVSTIIQFSLTELERRQVRSAFGHYLAPTVVDQLIADPRRLKLGGEKRETTFLFTDIANFTALTEKIEPTILVRLLNGYLDGTSRIVLQHGGTIDKIVGDALHVMFNAPTDQDDHADRAVNCALELDAFCHSYVLDQKSLGVTLGETRIGENTGVTVVGNFGGMIRFDYTAHGDAINTAARLESANRFLGTRMCVSVTTKNQCRNGRFRPVGKLTLKGKTEPLEVFEPINESRLDDPGLAEYEHAFALMERRAAEAVECLEILSERYPEDGLVAFHVRRLAAGESGTAIVLREK
jgi:adenylate cyclase